MRKSIKKKGFSTVELLTVIAILIVLASTLLKIAKSVRTQAEERLTHGQIDIVVTALQQYYDDNGDQFPFIADPCYMEADLQKDIRYVLGSIIGTHEDEYSSSEAIFYFLDRSPNSSRIIGAMSNTLISNKDQSGIALEMEIGGQRIDLVRFIDPWGKSLRYTYVDGNAFPVVESAGVDGKFNTSGDNITSR